MKEKYLANELRIFSVLSFRSTTSIHFKNNNNYQNNIWVKQLTAAMFQLESFLGSQMNESKG